MPFTHSSEALRQAFYKIIQADETLFFQIHEQASQGFCFWQWQQPEQAWANASFWQQVAPSQKKEQAWFRCFAPKDWQALQSLIGKALAEGKRELTQALAPAEGAGKWLARHLLRGSSADSLQIISIFTAYEHTEALAEAHFKALEDAEFYKVIVESQELYILKIALPERRFSYLNERYCSDYQLTRTEMQGKEAFAQLEGHRQQEYEAVIQKAIQTPQVPHKITLGQVLPDGSEKTAAWEMVGLLGFNNQVDEILCIGLDITEQRKAEATLQLNSLMLNSIGEAVVASDMAGYITFWNEAAQRIYGYTAEEVLGRSVLEVLPSPQHLEESQSVWQKLQEGQTYERELWMQGKKASPFLVESTTRFVFNEQQEAVGIIDLSKDITLKRQIEEALRASEEKFRNIVENAFGGIYMIRQGRYCMANKKFCEMLGYTEAELLAEGFDFRQLVPEISEEFENVLQRRAQGDKAPISYQVAVLTKSGAHRYFQVNTSVLQDTEGDYTLGIAIDITEAQLAQARLQESYGLLQKLTDNVPGVVYQFEMSANGAISFPFLSKGVEQLVQRELFLSLSENATSMFESVHPEDRQLFQDSIAQSARDLSLWEIQYRAIDAYNELRWYQGKARPERKADGTVVWYGIVQDITEAKQQNEALQNLVDITAAQNQRLLNFTYIVSHNIRSHVSNLIGVLGLLEEAEKEEEKEHFLGLLRLSTSKLDETLHNLNEVISIQSNPNQPKTKLPLNREINKTLDILRSDLLHTKAMVLNEVAPHITVEVVPAYLDSILLNLLSNALKYRKPEGYPHIAIFVTEEPLFTVLHIQDDGLGIDLPKHGHKLFGLYKTFHRNADARGVGLFITKNQIEAMQGKIEVASQPGEGTTFRVYFRK
jgi:PAS domain S-box-containing protein